MRIHTPQFDLSLTLQAGQTFGWCSKEDRSWAGWIESHPVILKQEGDTIFVSSEGCTSAGVRKYLGVDDDPYQLLKAYLDDPYLLRALNSSSTLRCIQDDFWECTVNFICSSQKQIPQIRSINALLRERYGEIIQSGHPARFPPFSVIARLEESSLRECRLGYRAKYLLKAARMLDDGSLSQERLQTLSTDEATKLLQTLPGVGCKVAQCILLYALRRWDAFPIDVWVFRMMKEFYFPRRRQPLSHQLLDRYSRRAFGEMRGLAQLHLFHYARHHTAK
ncbi:MAG: DNA-3-methyladenine glycosylase family protein [Candidatus Methylacidiphilales bacterium]